MGGYIIKRKKVFFVVGARPNFMKIAVLSRLMESYNRFRPIIVHTGQHYDYRMSQSFLEDLEIRKPDYFLNVGSGTHAQQTARVMARFEKVCLKAKPDLVVVVGDVNSTLATSITAKKLGIRTAHIEAGLRSFDISMPEEINRMVTDKMSDMLFVTEKSGMGNLTAEGIIGKSSNKNRIVKAFFVGNTMIDSLRFGLSKIRSMDVNEFSVCKLKESLKKYAVMTLHRPSNVDDKIQLKKLMEMIGEVSRDIEIVFPVHPRTRKKIKRYKIKIPKRVHAISPLGYLDFLYLYKDAKFIMTDSGGIQEEATVLKIPCLTLRRNTERPITVTEGTNIVIGDKLNLVRREARKILSGKFKKSHIPRFWDGKASLRIMKILNRELI